MSIIITINQTEQRLIIVPLMMTHKNMNWQIFDGLTSPNGSTEHLYIPNFNRKPKCGLVFKFTNKEKNNNLKTTTQ